MDNCQHYTYYIDCIQYYEGSEKNTNFMTPNQKGIFISIVTVTTIFWILLKCYPYMTKVMINYDPIEITFIIISWTVGMAAMMLPSFAPMILIYNRWIRSKYRDSNNNGIIFFMSHSSLVENQDKSDIKDNNLTLSIFHGFLNILFVGSYLLLWAITGIVLLLMWSISVSDFMMHFETMQQFQTFFGIILIISGVYQLSSIKRKCLECCEPHSFFIRRFRNGVSGAISMGIFHGIYCIGSCLPYCILMISLGWMNLIWMGLFTSIIFVEKIWSEGIWIARITGVMLVIIGVVAILGLITISTHMTM